MTRRFEDSAEELKTAVGPAREMAAQVKGGAKGRLPKGAKPGALEAALKGVDLTLASTGRRMDGDTRAVGAKLD